MAMNAAEGRRMLEASRRAPRLVAQLVPAPHTLELDGTLRTLLAEGYAGEVLAVEVRATQQAPFADPGEALHWRQNVALSGNNVLNMGIWYEAMMRWLGPARRVMAMTKIAVPRRKDEQRRLARGPGPRPRGHPGHARERAPSRTCASARSPRWRRQPRRGSSGARARCGSRPTPGGCRAGDRETRSCARSPSRRSAGSAGGSRRSSSTRSAAARRSPTRRSRTASATWSSPTPSPAAPRAARPWTSRSSDPGHISASPARPGRLPPGSPFPTPTCAGSRHVAWSVHQVPAVLAHVSRLVGLLLGAVLAVEVAAAVSRRSRRRKLHRWVHEHRRVAPGGLTAPPARHRRLLLSGREGATHGVRVRVPDAAPDRQWRGIPGAGLCRPATGGPLWEAWFVFFPLSGGPTLATDNETTQSKLDDVTYWATGISPAYLEGALTRALDRLPEARLLRHLARAEADEAYARAEAEGYAAAAEQALARARGRRTTGSRRPYELTGRKGRPRSPARAAPPDRSARPRGRERVPVGRVDREAGRASGPRAAPRRPRAAGRRRGGASPRGASPPCRPRRIATRSGSGSPVSSVTAPSPRSRHSPG